MSIGNFCFSEASICVCIVLSIREEPVHGGTLNKWGNLQELPDEFVEYNDDVKKFWYYLHVAGRQNTYVAHRIDAQKQMSPILIFNVTHMNIEYYFCIILF